MGQNVWTCVSILALTDGLKVSSSLVKPTLLTLFLTLLLSGEPVVIAPTAPIGEGVAASPLLHSHVDKRAGQNIIIIFLETLLLFTSRVHCYSVLIDGIGQRECFWCYYLNSFKKLSGVEYAVFCLPYCVCPLDEVAPAVPAICRQVSAPLCRLRSRHWGQEQAGRHHNHPQKCASHGGYLE